MNYCQITLIFSVALTLVLTAHGASGPFTRLSAPKSLRTQQITRAGGISSVITAGLVASTAERANAAGKAQYEYQPALEGLDYGKPRTYYPDFTQVKGTGLQYKVVKEGTGKVATKGDKVAVDWEGYTIGYYGRPFQTRNGPKGGAFDSSQSDFFRWIVGSGAAIGALDQVVQLLKEGTVAQVVIPAELGYPAKGDSEHDIVGPKPTTFSGMRALNFVLDNKNLIDKTLLININIKKVTPKAAVAREGE
jgi:FKBP-type peptidyl-prolyl cis-trans isomerase